MHLFRTLILRISLGSIVFVFFFFNNALYWDMAPWMRQTFQRGPAGSGALEARARSTLGVTEAGAGAEDQVVKSEDGSPDDRNHPDPVRSVHQPD